MSVIEESSQARFTANRLYFFTVWFSMLLLDFLETGFLLPSSELASPGSLLAVFVAARFGSSTLFLGLFNMAEFLA